MASKAQIQANRKNAARSTGPKTAAGKAASARNAATHGLSSARIAVLPSERKEDLDALANKITEEHRPQGDTETFLVHQMIAARWKLLRIERLEQEAFDVIVESEDGPANPDRCVLDTLEDNGNILDKLQRYAGTAERSYFKALRELQQLRSRAKQNEAKDAEIWLRKTIEDTPIREDYCIPPYSASQTEPANPRQATPEHALRR